MYMPSTTRSGVPIICLNCHAQVQGNSTSAGYISLSDRICTLGISDVRGQTMPHVHNLGIHGCVQAEVEGAQVVRDRVGGLSARRMSHVSIRYRIYPCVCWQHNDGSICLRSFGLGRGVAFDFQNSNDGTQAISELHVTSRRSRDSRSTLT
jgi:hypothetical protein